MEDNTKLIESIKSLGDKIDNEVATKSELKKFAEAMTEMDRRITRSALEEKRELNTIFANKAQAQDFINILKSALEKSNHPAASEKASAFYVDKAAGDPITSTATNAGADLIPTATSNVFSMLLAQGSVARQYATLYTDIQGSLVLTKRNTTSTAVYTATDISAVTATQLGTDKITLTPQQVSALSLVADKSLYASAVNVANAVAIDLIEQAGVLEDNTVIKGDGTATYASMTGFNTLSGVGEQTAVYSAVAVDDVLNLPTKVHESVYQSPNARFFMSGVFFSALQQKKASTAGSYFFDPTIQSFRIAGYPVVIWHRMDNSVAAGKYVAYFGDMAKAAQLAIGRDMAIEVDRSFAFNKNQTAFRLTYDFSFGSVQPSALARLKLTT